MTLAAANLISHTPAVVMADIAVIIIVARLMGALFGLIRQPAVVGEIVGGILLGPSLLGAFPGHLTTKLFPGDSVPHLQVLAQIGVVLFMFVIGLEVDPRLIRTRLVLAGTVSLSSVVLPFGLGILVAATVLHSKFGLVSGHEVEAVPFALFIGVSMSVTAFPVLARILAARRMQQTPLGTMALASAAMDDLLAWSLLAVVIGVVQATGGWKLPVLLLEAVALVGFLILVIRPLLDSVFGVISKWDDPLPLVLGILLVGVLATAAAADAIGVSVISGAFAFGACLPKKGHEVLLAKVVERVENLTVVMLLPLFFVVTGLTVNVRTLGWSGLGYLVLVVVLAIGGKFLGAAAGAKARGLTNRQSAAVGTLMNTRGLTELVILNVGHQLGVLGPKLFTIMVIMAVVTTVMTEPLLRVVYPDSFIKADLAEAERLLSRGAGGYQVLVVCDPMPPSGVLPVARGLAGPGGTVSLAAFVEGTGPNLALVASVMEDLRRIGGDENGTVVRQLVRVTDDPPAELLGQIRESQVDAVLVPAGSGLARALLADSPCHVLLHPTGDFDGHGGVSVLVGEGNDDDTSLELGMRLAIGTTTGLTLVPVHPGDRNHARRLVERARGLSPLHDAVVLGDEPPASHLVLAGLASAATAGDRPGGPLIAVRSGDDPRRVNLDQRFDRVRAAAGKVAAEVEG